MGEINDKNDNYWRERLPAEQYHVCREGGTERPFSGKYYQSKEDGVYCCACCGAPLFDSSTKYDSGTGWPSFWDVLENGNVVKETDTSHGMIRTEVHCANCGSHLGHVFPDGPEPTGLRYCVNSLSLKLEKR
jgi:peptide-methionine (R)-S-oxide reductase